MSRNLVSLPRLAVGFLLLAVLMSLTVSVGTPAAPVATKEPSSCKRPGHGFKATKAQIPALGRTVGVRVVPRTSSNQVGAGPTTEEGKWLMAMDPHNLPGNGRGTVMLSAHTWPDGSALGNAMLKNLHSGDRILLFGKNGEQPCYLITKRVTYRKDQVPRSTFSSGGFERMVLVTCSGTRYGPGNWSHRTVWYAKVVAPKAKPKPPPADKPPAEGGSSTLLGGVLGAVLG